MVMCCALQSHRLPGNFPSREPGHILHCISGAGGGGDFASGIVVEGSVMESASGEGGTVPKSE